MAGSSQFPHPLYEKYVLQPFFRDAEVYYYEPMIAANKTHVVMLRQCDIISTENAQAVLTALLQIEEEGLESLQYKSGVEDLFFTIEKRIIELAGEEFGGNLQLARSRNDLGYALTRLAIRPRLLEAMQYLLQLRDIILDFAKQHIETIMPGYTHTQPAQPSTMAHYMAGVLAFLARDMQRLIFAYSINNQSPLGAAALTGTGFPIDRELSAQLLGFEAVLESTYDSIASSDNLTDVAACLTSISINLSRMTKDMLFWATQESGAIQIDDSFIQISSIMPQKRNPVVLEHLRARLSRMLGYANAIVIQCHNIPFGDTQDIEDEIFPQLFGGLQTAVEILDLYSAVIGTLKVNVAHLSERAASGFSTVTELADTLVREQGLSFRRAHKLVSEVISYALANELTLSDIDSELVREIAEEKLGLGLSLANADIQRALDPEQFVAARTTLGGVAPSATQNVLRSQANQISSDRQWLNQEIQRLNDAQQSLDQSVNHVLQTT